MGSENVSGFFILQKFGFQNIRGGELIGRVIRPLRIRHVSESDPAGSETLRNQILLVSDPVERLLNAKMYIYANRK
jgi:hypothetical protein